MNRKTATLLSICGLVCLMPSGASADEPATPPPPPAVSPPAPAAEVSTRETTYDLAVSAGQPYRSVLGASFRYHLLSWARVYAGVGTVSLGRAFAGGVGIDLVVPDARLTPVAGIHFSTALESTRAGGHHHSHFAFGYDHRGSSAWYGFGYALLGAQYVVRAPFFVEGGLNVGLNALPGQRQETRPDVSPYAQIGYSF